MKKKVLGIAAATLLVGSITAYAGTQFSDISSSFARDAIENLGNKGIVNGRGDGTFDPKGNITREEEAAIIDRLLKLLEAKDAELAAKIAELEKPAPVPQPPAQTAPFNVENAGDYIVMEDLSQGETGWNVGFNIDHESLPYAKIRSITVSLLKDGNVIASRTAMTTQIDVLRDSDITYGGMDGQLSAFFVQRAESATNDYWTSTPYDLTAPDGASVTITTTDGKVYKVSR